MTPAPGQLDDGPPITFLLYHEFGLRARPCANLDCFCLADRFREQMSFIKNTGVRVVSASEACHARANGQRPDRPTVVLTFDDGDNSFLEHALPVLKDFCFPSIIFAVADQLGMQAKWVKDFRNAVPLMSGSQLRSLAADHVEIGSHSMTHRKLPDLPASEIAWELRESKARLEDVLGIPVTSLAYPHGRHDPVTMAWAQAYGYRYGFTTNAHREFNGGQLLQIPRTYVTYHDDLTSFAAKIGMTASIGHRDSSGHD